MLQTKTSKKCGNAFPPHCIPGVAVVRVEVALGGSFPRWQLSLVEVVLDGNVLGQVKVFRVEVFLGGDCPCRQLSEWQWSR